MYQLNFNAKHRKKHYPLNNEIGVLELCPLMVHENQNGEKRVSFESDFERMQAPNDSFLAEEILDEQEELSTEIRRFGPGDTPLHLHLPKQSIVKNYLFRYYGENCLTEAVSSHRHIRIPGTEINLFFPVFLKEKVPVEKKNCGQGYNRWRGPSHTAQSIA